MLMDLDDGHTEEVEIGSHDEKDWHQEGENQVDVVVQPAIISTGKNIFNFYKTRIYSKVAPPEAIHSLLVEESVHEEGAEDNEERTDVAQQVILNKSGAVRLEDLHQQDVDLEARDQHPEEGGEEDVLEDGGYDGAEGREVRLPDPKEESCLCQEQTETQVSVDGGPVVLGTPEGGEDIEADGETEDADGAAGVGQEVQVGLVELAGGQAVDVHQDGEVGEVITLTCGGAGAGGFTRL